MCSCMLGLLYLLQTSFRSQIPDVRRSFFLKFVQISHANYPLLEPDAFGRVGGGFVKDVILTSFWRKHIFDPSLTH